MTKSIAYVFLHAHVTIIGTVSTIERVSDPLSVGAHPARARCISINSRMDLCAFPPTPYLLLLFPPLPSCVSDRHTYVFYYPVVSDGSEEFRTSGRNIPAPARRDRISHLSCAFLLPPFFLFFFLLFFFLSLAVTRKLLDIGAIRARSAPTRTRASPGPSDHGGYSFRAKYRARGELSRRRVRDTRTRRSC